MRNSKSCFHLELAVIVSFNATQRTSITLTSRSNTLSLINSEGTKIMVAIVSPDGVPNFGTNRSSGGGSAAFWGRCCAPFGAPLDSHAAHLAYKKGALMKEENHTRGLYNNVCN